MKAIALVLRGCSAAWLGAYGNEWIATPNLDRLAAEGIVFDRHISNCPDHTAACRTWLTTHPVPKNGTKSQNLLNSLRSAGVKTILVRANHPDTDAPDSFYADWDELFDVRPQEEDHYALDSLIRSLPGLLDRLAGVPDFLLWIDIDSLIPPWKVRQEVFEAYVEDAEDEGKYPQDSEVEESVDEEGDEVELEDDADEREDEPALDEAGIEEENLQEEADGAELSEEEREPVTPWADPPTGPFDAKDLDALEWLHWSLAAVVTGLDAELGVIFQQLRDHGLDQTAAWLLTSDFGYPLGEHGQIGLHRPWLYEELVHLPLLLRLPDAAEACRRVAQFTRPEDISPTLLDLFKVPGDFENTKGKSLLPFVHGETTIIRESAITKLEIGLAAESAIRTKDWSFLLPLKVPQDEHREPQLFGKPDDRWEVNDVHTSNIERCDELEEKLRKEEREED